MTEPTTTTADASPQPPLAATVAPGAVAKADDVWSGLPRWIRPAYPHHDAIVRFGRAVPKAAGMERAFFACVLFACVAVLALAVWLKPDDRGFGTHEKLGLPPCGFVEMFDGVPCPSCGYTTTFAYAAEGSVAKAFTNQPFGFLVFLATVAAVPLAGLALFGKVSLFAMSERWPWPKLFAVMGVLWLAAWGYKWHLMV